MGFGNNKAFVPTTKEELRKIRKRAAKRDKERSESKKSKSARKGNVGNLRQRILDGDKDLTIFSENLFATFVSYCKESNLRLPRYRRYMESKDADTQFMFDVNTALCRLSWKKLHDLTLAGLVAHDGPSGLSTANWTEAFHFAQHVMYLALHAVEKKGVLRLTDRSVLDDWPVDDMKRPSKEDRMKPDYYDSSYKMLAKRDDEDADVDEEEDEDEADDEEEEDDEEDEKPAKSRKKKAKGSKKKASSDDEDEEEEDDDEEEEDDDDGEDEDDEESEDDDDDEDEEDDEKPVKKAKSSKKKSSKKEEDEDEEDEDEDEDDDSETTDEEDEDVKKPKKKAAKKSGSKAATKKTVSKKTEKVEREELSDSTTVVKGKARERGGKKSDYLKLIPKAGIKVKALVAQAVKELGLNQAKAKKWLGDLHAVGYIKAK